MCLFKSPPAPTPPQMPAETATMRQPDNAAVKDATSRRAGEKVAQRSNTVLTSGRGVTNRAAVSNTVLTSGTGVDSMAMTGGKTLLGQ